MSITCALTPEQEGIFQSVLIDKLKELVTSGDKFSFDKYIKTIYDMRIEIGYRNTPNPMGDELRHIRANALKLARLTPIHLNTALFYNGNDDIKKYIRANGFSYDSLHEYIDKTSDTEDGVKFILDIVNPVSKVENLNAIQDVINEELEKDRIPKQADVTVENSPTIPSTIGFFGMPFVNNDDSPKKTYSPNSMQSHNWEVLDHNIDSENYNVIDEEQKLNFLVMRKILSEIFKPGNNQRSSNINYPGVGQLYINIQSSSTLDPKDVIASTDQQSEEHKTGVAMVVVDKYGRPVRFDDNGIVKEDGKLIYYLLRRPDETVVLKNGQVELTSEDKLRAAALSRQNPKLTIEVAESIIKKELKTINDIREYINKDVNSNTIRVDINGGFMGQMIPVLENVPMTKINFTDEAFNPYISKKKDEFTGEENGRTYFKMSTTGESIIEIERPEVSLGMADKIASILLDDIWINDNGNRRLITLTERQYLLDSYINTSKEILRIPTKEDNVDYTVELKGEPLYTRTDSEKEASRKAIISLLTTMGGNRAVAFDELTPRQKTKIVVPVKDKQYPLNTVLNYDKLNSNAHYFIVEFPKLHVNKERLGKSDSFEDIELSKNDKGELEGTRIKKSYKQWILENFFIKKQLDKNGKVSKLNAFLTFEPIQSELDKLYETKKVEDVVKEIKEKSKNNEAKTSLRQPLNTTIDDLMKEVEGIKQKKFFKNKIQKDLDIIATAQQIIQAKEWFRDSPLSKHVKFETLFNMINTANPSNVASLGINGIRLYKGSDYTDLYHEAWHAFTQGFLTTKQKDDLYKAVSKLTGTFKDYNDKTVFFNNATIDQLEEWLAEDFRKFMLTGKYTYPIAVKDTIFRKILNFLKLLFDGYSYDEIVSNERNSKILNELYDKLKIGNINEYSYNEANFTRDTLNKGIGKFDINDIKDYLSYQDSKTIIDSVDSIISEFIDMRNSNLSEQEMIDRAIILNKQRAGIVISTEEGLKLQALEDERTYEYSGIIAQSEVGIKAAYKYVLLRFSLLHNEAQEQLESLPVLSKDELDKLDILENKSSLGTITNKEVSEYRLLLNKNKSLLKNSLQKRIDTLTWAINNFGDISKLENNKDNNGVISYHQSNSEFLSKEDKEEFFKLQESEDDKFTKDHDKSGNEFSLKHLADNNVLYLIKGLHAVDSDGNALLNPLGVQEIASFETTFNKLARLLENGRDIVDTRDVSADKKYGMYDKINEASINYPPFEQLLKKLGPPNRTSKADEFKLWTSFWQAFNKTRIPLIQLSVDHITGKDTYELTVGNASGLTNKIKKRWESNFATSDSRYIYEKDNNGNFLDLSKIRQDFPTKKDALLDPIGFLNAIGIPIENNRDIITEIGKGVGNLSYLYDKLFLIQARNNEIKSLNDIYKPYDSFEITVNGKKQTFKALDSDNGRLGELMNLQAKYSEDGGTFSVVNAENKQQFEHSLNNTMSVVINTINQVSNYAELLQYDYMSYLNIDKNPMVSASVWLNSIFVLDVPKYNSEYGKKRMVSEKEQVPVRLEISNISGVAFLNDGIMTEDGISNTNADEFSKFILDYHSLLDRGVVEMMRHADKSSSFSTRVSKLNTKSKSNSPLYVDIETFIESEDKSIDEVYDIVIKHLSSEHERVNMFKKTKEEGAGEYDYNYLERGLKFVTFDDVISKETKEKLYLLEMNLNDYLKLNTQESLLLKDSIKLDFIKYFNKQVEVAKERMKKADFSSLNRVTKKQLQKEHLSTDDLVFKDAALKAYVYNSWIHNVESLVLFYGDVAQYKNANDFHKRNASVGATGNLFRTDKDAIDYINQLVKRPYAAKKGYEQKIYDGTLDTAILEDIMVESSSIKEYEEHIAKDIRKRYTSKSETEIVSIIDKVLKSYRNMTEGDGQGWITMDSYRMMSILEGKWSSKQEALYYKIVSGEEIGSINVIEYFPSLKLQYSGQLKTDKVPLMGFHKFSLVPLIPTIIKGSHLEQLHNRMMKNDIDYATFKSGSKMCVITNADNRSDSFYSKKDENFIDKPFVKNTIYVQYLKDQLNINTHHKGNVTFSTQMRKLIEDGLAENGMPIDFQIDTSYQQRKTNWDKLDEKGKIKESKYYELYSTYESHLRELTDINKEQLLKEAKWDIDKDGNLSGKIVDMLSFIKQELGSQGLAEHELDFIDANNKGIVDDLSYSLSVEKIEKILNSIVVNRLVKSKVSGEALIQVANTGFEKKGLRNATDEENQKYKSNDLPSYKYDKKGTKACKVKIAMTSGKTVNSKYVRSNFEKLLSLKDKEGNRINTIARLNELIKDDEWLDIDEHRRMITLVGVRIPVQALNSMEFMEIYEFLEPEAGNMIILPSEIVAKSGGDFDIDKLTVMFPSYRNIEGKVSIERKYTEKEIKGFYKGYQEFKLKTEKERQFATGDKVNKIDDIFIYDNLFKGIFGVSSDELDEELVSMLEDEEVIKSYDEFKLSFNNKRALEGDILWDIKKILSLEHNFVKLISPNSTYLLSEIADDLAQKLNGYNPKDRVFESEDKEVSGTRVLEIEHNIYKHKSNSIGMQTLGMGAVGNTYNTLMNRVGAYLNSYSGISKDDYERINNKEKKDKEDYKVLAKYRRQVLLMKHNSLDIDGEKVISLSNIYDSNNENRISEIIAQMINGWVDVAKDAWIFYIQGNKEITPSLTFLIEAGVPLKTAIYFVSMPIVRDYVDKQRLVKSAFARPLGINIEHKNFYKSKSRELLLGDPKYGFNMNIGILSGAGQSNYIYNKTIEATEGLVFDEQKLYDVISNPDEHVDMDNALMYDDYQRAAFLHFLEIEDMTKSIRDLKMRTNVDTKKDSTIFSSQERLMNIEELRENNSFPTEIVDDILGVHENGKLVKANSPISSYFVQEFQGKIWKDVLKLRSNDILNNYILDIIRYDKDLIDKTYPGDNERFVNTFKNDFINYIFQNSVRAFDLENISTFMGNTVEKEFPVQYLRSLSIGVFVANGKLYVDRATLVSQYNNNVYSSATYKELGLAQVGVDMFATAKEYYKFVFERETLRDSIKLEKIITTDEFKEYLKLHKKEVVQKRDESKEDYLTRIGNEVYEMFLRDKALDNIYNGVKLFYSNDSYADQYFAILNKYPNLKKDYDLLNSLSINDNKGISTLRLKDTELDKDRLNILHENLLRLSDRNVIKVSDISENNRISDYFERFSIVAFLQSGLNSKGADSLVRIVPTNKYKSLIRVPIEQYNKHMNPVILDDFASYFEDRNNIKNKSLNRTYKNYISDMTLKKSVAINEKGYEKVNDVVLTSYHAKLLKDTYVYDSNKLQKVEDIDNMLSTNKGTIFIYNGVPEGTKTPIGDSRVSLSNEGNKYPISVNIGNYKEDIDSSIEQLLKLKESGKGLAFSNSGYGTSLNEVSKESFLYLSKQLYDNFGYINKGYLVNEEAKEHIQSKQDITDNMVREFMNKCK